MPSSFVLAGARVYRHGGDTDMPAVADVLVREGKIAAIGPGLTGEEHETIDLTGHLLVPGFVNGHYHSHDVLAKGMFESISLERWGIIAGAIGANRPVEEVRLRTLVGALECVRNGITTIQDFANLSRYDPETVDAMVEAYESVGVRVILAVTVRDKSQLDTILWADQMVPAEHHGIIGTGAGDGLAQVDFLGRQIDRVGDRAGRVIWAISPSAPQRCSLPLLKRVAQFAGERDLPVYTHVYETRLQRIFARERLAEHGGSAIDYMAAAGLLGPRVTIAHGVWPDSREIGRLADSGTGVVLNMLSNLRLRSGIAPLAAYRRAGMALSLGCDNCSCSDVQSMHQVMKLYCMLTGIADPGPERASAAEALRMASEGGARAAGLASRLGAIEVGMAADLVAYDLSDPAWRPFNSAARQLVYAETGRGLRHVWVGGERIVADGRSTRVDEAGVIRQVEAMMPRVRQDIDALARQADIVEPAMQAIQARAFATDIGFDRYLPRS
jgi:cytosine/adenosine deaminase-related metal-dependent hydrolase